MGCYFCDGETSSVEHIPPKSFFPKGKRKDLITVESCNTHNQEKSKEDEYILTILLASAMLDNKPHINELRETNNRAIQRSANRAVKKIQDKEKLRELCEIIEKYKEDPLVASKSVKEIQSKGITNFGLLGLINSDTKEETITHNGSETKTTSFKYDQARFNAFFEGMARGLFFHELGQPWKGEVSILAHTFLKPDAQKRDKDLSHEFLQHFDREAAKGSQKEFFCYEGANMQDPKTGEISIIFFNFCLFDTFYFTAVFQRV